MAHAGHAERQDTYPEIVGTIRKGVKDSKKEKVKKAKQEKP